jgi:NAD+ synthase (glutamine-hydrolysing)
MAAIKIGIAQINACVGDLAGNAKKVMDAARTAHAAGARLLLTPELVLCGYPPEDLLLRPAFIEQAQTVADSLCKELAELQGLHVVLGHPVVAAGGLRNAASVLVNG